MARNIGTAQLRNCRRNRLKCISPSTYVWMPITMMMAIPRRKSKYVSLSFIYRHIQVGIKKKA